MHLHTAACFRVVHCMDMSLVVFLVPLPGCRKQHANTAVSALDCLLAYLPGRLIGWLPVFYLCVACQLAGHLSRERCKHTRPGLVSCITAD